MATTGSELCQRWGRVKRKRANFDDMRQSAAEVIIPRLATITERPTVGGERHDERLYDSTAVRANEKFAAVMESLNVPASMVWHKLRARDDDLNRARDVRAWFEQANQFLYDLRYSPRSGFKTHKNEAYQSVGAFGDGVIFIEERPDGIVYHNVFVGDVWWEQNADGLIDTVFRRVPLSARNAVAKWGRDKLSDKVVEASEKPEAAYDEFDFLHVVLPRIDVEPGKLDRSGMPFAEYYVDPESKEIIAEGGYWKFPYGISRYMVAPNEVYGRGPGVMMLGDIKQLQRMHLDVDEAVQMQLKPPILIADEGILSMPSDIGLKPGWLNWGGVNEQGDQLMQPFHIPGDLAYGEQAVQIKQEVINDGFLLTIYRILAENPQMTATQALLIAQEKGELLAPMMGRQQNEDLGPMIEMELDIALRNGWIDPPPPEFVEAGAEFDVEYMSPMAQAARSGELTTMNQVLELSAPYMQADPLLMLMVDGEAAMRRIHEVSGAPVDQLRSDDEYRALRKAAEEAQAAREMAEQAPGVAGAVRDVADAAATTGQQR